MLEIKPLSTLERVELRSVWNYEAHNFTPWLAQESNLALLGKTLNLELGLEECEKEVGPFRADILCKDINSDRWVLIENQLEDTNHSHLGQIITYAAGLRALTIIWITKRFKDEHRAALDWLNQISDESVHFFGLEIELWKIGDSLPAPKFNIIVKPNDWSSQVSNAANKLNFDELSSIKKLQFEYWKTLISSLKESSSIVRPRKPRPAGVACFGIGRTNTLVVATVNSQKSYISVEFWLQMNDAKKHFKQLQSHRYIIDNEIGGDIEWIESPENKLCRISKRFDGVEFTDQDDWARQHSWLKENLECFYRVFNPLVKTLSFEP